MFGEPAPALCRKGFAVRMLLAALPPLKIREVSWIQRVEGRPQMQADTGSSRRYATGKDSRSILEVFRWQAIWIGESDGSNREIISV
jgi:hypothetical protein